jgi:hypothetical protein
MRPTSRRLSGFFVAGGWYDFRNRPPGSAELDGDDPRSADDLAAEASQLGGTLRHILHFDAEVMDAWAAAGGERLRGFLLVIFDKCEIDRTVGQMARGMIPYFPFVYGNEAKQFS